MGLANAQSLERSFSLPFRLTNNALAWREAFLMLTGSMNACRAEQLFQSHVPSDGSTEFFETDNAEEIREIVINILMSQATKVFAGGKSASSFALFCQQLLELTSLLFGKAITICGRHCL